MVALNMERTLNKEQDIKSIACAYLDAKKYVIKCGYAYEIDWQEHICINNVTETDFLRETAWVILSVGMNEKVIRKKFEEFSNAFFDWVSASIIIENKETCISNAQRVFNHKGKINAIINIALAVVNQGLSNIINNIKVYGIEYLMSFPFIGPAASCHLAKNLGISMAKPDRHLLRVSKLFGYNTPQSLCYEIAEIVGDEISTIDIVIWRYATLRHDYLEHFISYLNLNNGAVT